MKTHPVFPSNPLERDLLTPTKQIEIGKGVTFQQSNAQKSPGRKTGAVLDVNRG